MHLLINYFAKNSHRRGVKLLGFDEYEEGITDGLQVLRYNQSNAYIPHLDWIEDPNSKEVHNYHSDKIGTNRFATILLYMSDLPEGGGGQTVFTRAWPIGQKDEEHVEMTEVI